jgi:hypothetical protein
MRHTTSARGAFGGQAVVRQVVKGWCLAPHEPGVELLAAKLGLATREVMLGDSLTRDGVGERPRAYAQVSRCLVSVHPLLRSHPLKSLGGAGEAVCGPRERRRDPSQGLRLDSLQGRSRLFKVVCDLPEAPNLPIARLPQQASFRQPVFLVLVLPFYLLTLGAVLLLMCCSSVIKHVIFVKRKTLGFSHTQPYSTH